MQLRDGAAPLKCSCAAQCGNLSFRQATSRVKHLPTVYGGCRRCEVTLCHPEVAAGSAVTSAVLCVCAGGSTGGVSLGGLWLVLLPRAVGSGVGRAGLHISFSSSPGHSLGYFQGVRQGPLLCATSQIMLELIVMKDCYFLITCHSRST